MTHDFDPPATRDNGKEQFFRPRYHYVLAEEAECVTMCLDRAGVPTEEDGKPLSLWGRVLAFAGKANDQGMP